MHEWALAEAVISTSIKTSQHENLKKISEIIIKVGELQQIETEILEFALTQFKKDRFKGTDFHIETAKAEMKCRVCGHRWFFTRENLDEETEEFIHFVPEVAHIYIKCPKCGSPDFEVLRGRGIWLESIKGVE